MRTFITNELQRAEETANKTVAALRAILTKQVRRYGWSDGGALYIGGSLARQELSRSSDIDLILIKSEAARDGKYSPSAVSAFRTAAIATLEIGRKVSVAPVSDVQAFVGNYAPVAFRSGLLKGGGKDQQSCSLLSPESFTGENGDRQLRRLFQNLVGLASIATLDRDCMRVGFNGYRYATLAGTLAEILGTDQQRADAETQRKLLFAYCQAAERSVGHCGLDAVQDVVNAMSDPERADGGIYLEDALETARRGVRKLLVDLIPQN